MLYKALTSDMKSPEGYGVPFGPWVKDQWYEIEGPVHFDPSGVTGPVPNGFFCSPDLIQTTFSVTTEFICEVETDGASVVYENNQWWQKMRVVSIKAWPPSKAALILDWAEGRAHDVWAGRFVSEAEIYAMKQYQGQWADMLEVIQPVYKSLYADNDFYLFPKIHQFNTLKPEYTRQFERLVRLAYIFALVKTGNLTAYGGGPFVSVTERARPGSWDIIEGFARDHWAGLAEV
jgi:hypothetical protein